MQPEQLAMLRYIDNKLEIWYYKCGTYTFLEIMKRRQFMNGLVNNELKTPRTSTKRGRGWFIAALIFSLLFAAVFAYYAALTVSTVEAILTLLENPGGSEQFGAGLGAGFGIVFMIIFGGAALVVGVPATILAWVGVSRSDPPFKLCNQVLGVLDVAMIVIGVIAFVAVVLMV